MKNLTLIIICFFLGLAFGQSIDPIPIAEMFDDPGLVSYSGLGIDYQWTPSGDYISFFSYQDHSNTVLCLLNPQTLSVDTLLSEGQLIWIDLLDTISIDIRSAKWSNTGQFLLFIGANDLFLFNVQQTALLRLTTDGIVKVDVQFSPDDRWVSFIQNHNLWTIALDSKRAEQLTAFGNDSLYVGELDWIYAKEFRLTHGYKWSPNSQRILFLQLDQSGIQQYPIIDYLSYIPVVNKYYYPLAGTRNPGVSLGVISVADHEVQWLVLKSDRPEYLVRFDWLQDSQQIAYQTLNRSQNLLQLFFVDLRSGGKNVVLEEKDPFWLNVEDLYYFFSDRPNFIWYSEFDGYRHLYLYDNSGSIIKQLTDGLWCVTSLVAVDEKRQLVYFTSNAENILEQHLYSVNLINGECIRIDKEQAFHIVDFSLQNNFYIDKTETTDKPLELHLKSVTGQEILTLYKNRLFNQERYKFGTTVFLNVTADDGTPLKATLLYPYDFNPELKYPVLIYAHGGPREQLVQNKFPQIWHQLLAQRGYLIFILDNRGSYGRSRDWERKIFLELGRFELEDQLCGVHYLQDLTYVDSKRIGIWGSGYGGYLTLLALTQTPGNFKTGIAIEPIVDWKLYNTVFSERYMGLPTENSRGYWNSSPLNLASQLQADLLLIHGMQDDDIHLQHSIRFLNALENYNIPCQVLIYPEQKNLLRNSTERRHLYETMTRFLQEHL